ncbi:uncharacterized protein H6S33_005366 [Morchella sextelata]|uniref:uncharacterized protein n=1 Tax=Morchella sextelata TaxID=1174677 RepID=UPI001D046604|nr:uncharacterized protein H6S33_005366 [Morchella sextelata]KAH0613480.1 hypothetical protein H6S33_005366 [Morchella sextelata]
MKLIKKTIERDMTGSIILFPEEPEDMWHAFNLIRPGDRLRANAVRRVTLESKTGSTQSQRIQTVLTIQVDKVDFDAQAGQLHLNGRVCEENKHVAVGVHHTLDLELFRNFTVIKAEWDSVTLDMVRDACDAKERSEIGAVVLQEGLANVCFITDHMTILRQKVEVPVPRKRKGIVSNYEKGLEKFYEATYQSLLRHFDFTALKVILLASPGFVAEGLRDYIFATALRTDAKPVLVAKPKFVVVHCASGHIHSLNEVLKSPAVTAKLTDTKFARETRAVEKFFVMMNTDEARAWYGPREVARAVEKGAVGTLLVSNSLFRSNKSGIRLDGLGGIAAILTFPLEGLDEDSGEEEGEGDGEEEEGEGPEAAAAAAAAAAGGGGGANGGEIGH